MSQNQMGKWANCVLCIAIGVMIPIGCNHLNVCKMEDPIRAADYPLVFRDGPKLGKDAVVAVFVSSTPEIRKEFEGIEGQLVSNTAKKLQELAREQKQKLVVLDPTLVNKFKKKNPDWNSMYPNQWGKELKVDWVLDIHLDKMSLYQPGSNNQFYEGRAEVTVNVYDVDAGIAEPKYNYLHPFKYPHTGVFDSSTMPVVRFKYDFLEHLAAELAMKHIEHKVDSEIAKDK